jgi:hypothetical protein
MEPLIEYLDLLTRSVLMWPSKATTMGTIHDAPIPLEESDAPILAFLIQEMEKKPLHT